VKGRDFPQSLYHAVPANIARMDYKVHMLKQPTHLGMKLAVRVGNYSNRDRIQPVDGI